MKDLLSKEDLTLKEAAQLLRITPAQVADEFKDKNLRGWRKTGARNAKIFIFTDSVVEFAEKIQGRSLKERSAR